MCRVFRGRMIVRTHCMWKDTHLCAWLITLPKSKVISRYAWMRTRAAINVVSPENAVETCTSREEFPPTICTVSDKLHVRATRNVGWVFVPLSGSVQHGLCCRIAFLSSSSKASANSIQQEYRGNAHNIRSKTWHVLVVPIYRLHLPG